LSLSLDRLFDQAKAAQLNAYAPYSHFKVGAAILAENDRIFSGANAENAAYPQGQCAEASAIGAMVTGGARQIREILIIADGTNLCTPCGGCRQRIREFANADTLVHVAGPGDVRKTFTFADLLPDSFGPDNLKR
jgi:cytidine deaminase